MRRGCLWVVAGLPGLFLLALFLATVLGDHPTSPASFMSVAENHACLCPQEKILEQGRSLDKRMKEPTIPTPNGFTG
jgi:hypothetical protein